MHWRPQQGSAKLYVSIVGYAYASVNTTQCPLELNFPREEVGYQSYIRAHTTTNCTGRLVERQPNCDCPSNESPQGWDWRGKK